jgi:hypothetical protein
MKHCCCFFFPVDPFFPFFAPLFLDLSRSKKRDLFPGCLFCAKNLLHVSTLFFCLKDIHTIELKRCLHSPPNLLASKSSPRPRRRRNRSTKLYRCVCLIVYTYTSMRFLALCSFSLKGFFVRAFWKVNSLSIVGSHHTRAKSQHARALKSTDYLLTTRLSSSYIIHP